MNNALIGRIANCLGYNVAWRNDQGVCCTKKGIDGQLEAFIFCPMNDAGLFKRCLIEVASRYSTPACNIQEYLMAKNVEEAVFTAWCDLQENK